ncbi:hypothetical protein L596_015902 [Steinernema carpocapsae]|uniref:Uncharacterized protein n=1 Tax=Steinernema carpocapsae TaxID=34508 RepID=A0A4U5NGC4_STECR|nr:hypothetical protein L596_015902 [Steinernema carpocapsae]
MVEAAWACEKEHRRQMVEASQVISDLKDKNKKLDFLADELIEAYKALEAELKTTKADSVQQIEEIHEWYKEKLECFKAENDENRGAVWQENLTLKEENQRLQENLNKAQEAEKMATEKKAKHEKGIQRLREMLKDRMNARV